MRALVLALLVGCATPAPLLRHAVTILALSFAAVLTAPVPPARGTKTLGWGMRRPRRRPTDRHPRRPRSWCDFCGGVGPHQGPPHRVLGRLRICASCTWAIPVDLDLPREQREQHAPVAAPARCDATRSLRAKAA